MGAPSFAGPGDYERRYGEGGDRVAAILADASAAMAAEYEAHWGEPWEPGARPSFDRAAEGVCCALARRALSAPAGFEGASQYSRTAGPYSASVTLANPTGDIYLGKSDLRRLGLTGSVRRSLRPMIGGGRA